MRKLLAILLILSLAVTMLCSCKKGDAHQKGGTAGNASTTTPQETTVDVDSLVNKYQNTEEPEVIEGNVTHQVHRAWWENSELVVEMYIINGMADPIYDLFIENMAAYNEEGLFAQVSIGPLATDPIPAGEYILETFRFGYGVDLPDADLTTLSMECSIDFTY